MPHRFGAPLVAVHQPQAPPRRLATRRVRDFTILAALSQLACSRSADGELYITLDTTDPRSAVEVVALPFDPAALPRSAPPRRPSIGTPTGDSVSRYLALRDSAFTLDAEFQRERVTLNREAIALRHDTARRSPAYAQRYDAWARRAAAAEQSRAVRDRLRARLATLRTRLGPAAPPDSPDGATRVVAGGALDSAARASGRTPVRTGLSPGGVTLRLPPGRWWVTVGTPRGALADRAVPIDVRAGVRDTVRLSGTVS